MVSTWELGPLFIDLETCCRGPVEFDLAHVLAAGIIPMPIRRCSEIAGGSSWRS